MGEIVKKDQQSIAVNQPTNLLEAIGRMSTDPNVDVEKFERMMAMYERMEIKQSEREFNVALSQVQNDLPEITEGGEIKHGDKLISKYARWDEDINPAIKPILQKHGLALSFRTQTNSGVEVTAVLSHVAGHSISTSIYLPADTSGSKNAVQSVASSVSYGKRYTASALLNLTARGQDDDGVSAIQVPTISDSQVADLESLIDEVKADRDGFEKWMRGTLKCNSVEELNENGFKTAVQILEAKRRQA